MGQTASSRASLTWDREPFAEGATRWAFKAKVGNGSFEGYPSGTDLVLKVIKKDCYEKGIRLTAEDIKAQDLTREYCDKFNTKKFANKMVFSRSGTLITATENYYGRRDTLKIMKDETMMIEQYIHGEYEKFNSNSGWSDDTKSLPNFFSHWTWVESNGKHLVCDLQGHRGRKGGPPYGDTHDYYLFTDPVVMTDGPGLQYGCSDLGYEGQLKWFSKHKCNHICLTHGLADRRPTQPENCTPSDDNGSMTVRRPTGLERFRDDNPWIAFQNFDNSRSVEESQNTTYRPHRNFQK